MSDANDQVPAVFRALVPAQDGLSRIRELVLARNLAQYTAAAATEAAADVARIIGAEQWIVVDDTDRDSALYSTRDDRTLLRNDELLLEKGRLLPNPTVAQTRAAAAFWEELPSVRRALQRELERAGGVLSESVRVSQTFVEAMGETSLIVIVPPTTVYELEGGRLYREGQLVNAYDESPAESLGDPRLVLAMNVLREYPRLVGAVERSLMPLPGGKQRRSTASSEEQTLRELLKSGVLGQPDPRDAWSKRERGSRIYAVARDAHIPRLPRGVTVLVEDGRVASFAPETAANNLLLVHDDLDHQTGTTPWGGFKAGMRLTGVACKTGAMGLLLSTLGTVILVWHPSELGAAWREVGGDAVKGVRDVVHSTPAGRHYSEVHPVGMRSLEVRSVSSL